MQTKFLHLRRGGEGMVSKERTDMLDRLREKPETEEILGLQSPSGILGGFCPTTWGGCNGNGSPIEHISRKRA